MNPNSNERRKSYTDDPNEFNLPNYYMNYD